MQNLSQYKFNILTEIKPKIAVNIKLFYIFGETGNEVIIVTNDDKVLSFGSNKTGSLGLGHNNPTKEPTIVEELCDQQVVDFSSGFNYVMALTKCGQIYTWGSNSFGELGNETKVANYKPIINKTLSDNNIKVIKMSCGYSHSIVLTNTAELYGFGRNDYGQVGCGNITPQLKPIKISHEVFNSDKVKSISCGAYHSIALTDSGKVYIWGYNLDGRLGIESNTNKNLPTIIGSINETVIKKVIGGSTHSMLLSNDGSIYMFGVNNLGQLGNETQVSQNIPIKLNKAIGFADIASDCCSSLSIATSMNGFCYVWGDCVKGVLTTPIETIFTSIHDIYAFYSKRKVTYIPINTENVKPRNRYNSKFADLFNNSEKSDIKIKIDNQYIFAHKWFLKTFCKHFETLLSENWTTDETNEIEITQYSYSVYYAFIKYLYSDCLDINVNEAIDLLDLANSYLEEELKYKCALIIENSISVENVCDLYSAAVKYSSKELEDFCFEYTLNKMNKICKTDAFERMDENLCKKLFKRTAEYKTI